MTLLSLLLLGLVSYLVPSLVPLPLRELVGGAIHPLGSAPAPAGSGGYRFLAHEPGNRDDPVAYDPCRSVHVVLDPTGGPADAVRLTRDAIARVSRATGLRFRYDGLTHQRPDWRSPYLPDLLGRARPVLVAFATAREVPQLRGDVAGIGGSVPVEEQLTGRSHYVSGEVTLDSDAFRRIMARPDGAAEAEAIILHEFGHVVGLAHVDDPGELMYGEDIGRIDYGPGDLRGLAALGRGSCW